MKEYRDFGDWVLTVNDAKARGRGGIPVETRVFQLWQVQNGKIVTVRLFGSEAEALKAADPHGRKAVLAANVMHDRKPKPYSCRRVAAMDHQRIADRLDLARLVCGEQGVHRRRELRYEI